MKITYYIKRLRQIPLIEKKLLFKGILCSLVFVPIVYLLPLKHYIRFLKNKPKLPVTVNDKKYLIRLARKTMRRIERFSPFRFSCLIKSMTFKSLLNSFGITSIITFGVNNSQPHLLRAHAYIKVDDEIVYLRKRRYREVYLIN